MDIYSVLTDTKAQHPWAKYYADRGIARPPVSRFTPAASRRLAGPAGASAAAPKRSEISAELAAAAALFTKPAPDSTAAPFITAMQKEAAARGARQHVRLRFAKIASMAVAALLVVHFTVTRLLYRAPSEEAVLAHVESLDEAILPLFSSFRQPLQADGVVISQADAIDAQHYRYVATVTLRLRKPLYVPAISNGTANYRRLQQALQGARDQETRFKLFAEGEMLDAPSLPLLLQRTHQAGETIIVRVPFTARRFGWQWKLDAPQLTLGTPNRLLTGDALERYENTPFLIFGTTSTLAEIRQRMKAASNYVLAVAKQVQRRSDVVAVADPAASALAARPAQPSLEDLPALESLADVAAKPAENDEAEAATKVALALAPAIDPNAPAVFAPATPAKFFSAPTRTAAR